jgi:hypothetical protein
MITGFVFLKQPLGHNKQTNNADSYFSPVGRSGVIGPAAGVDISGQPVPGAVAVAVAGNGAGADVSQRQDAGVREGRQAQHRLPQAPRI